MKAKYIEWHNNYPFELGEIYDIMPYDDEWVRFEYDNQLYRKECFEFVGVLKALVSHVDDFGLLPKTINQIQRETIVNEYTELEAKAAKWDNPQTQADLELAAAVKAWFNQKNWHSSFAADMGMACKRFNSIDKLINWFREQK